MTLPTKRPRGRPKDEALSERRREEILDAAATAFAHDGYAATDLQAIADAAKVSKGALYHYFPTKEALFLAAVDRGLSLLHAEIDAATAAAPDGLEKFAAGVRAYLAFFRGHPELVELLILERAAFRDRPQSTYFAHKAARRRRWEPMVQALMGEGRLRRQPVERLLDNFGDLLYGVMFTHHFGGRLRPLDEQVRDVIDFAFYGILGESERRRRRKGDA